MTYSVHFNNTKISAYTILGNKCAECGETSCKLLEIDHKYGYKKTDGPRGGYQLYLAIIERRIDLSILQLLCRKCHTKKSRNETIQRSKENKQQLQQQENLQVLKLLNTLTKTIDPKIAIAMVQSVVTKK